MKNFKPFLLSVFLLGLGACSTFTLEKSSSEIISVSGEKFHCEYIRGEKVHCEKIIDEKEIENEKISA